ncbi:MAG: GIY-YIG nuclease family protein [Raineya sp.]
MPKNKKEFFPPRPSVNPTIYAYELPNDSKRKGQLKIGYTDRDAHTRIKEQIGATRADFKIVFEESAMRADGSSFTDKTVHALLRKYKIPNPDGEWFVCTLNQLRKAIHEIKTGEKTEDNRVLNFAMRPEQQEAVTKTMAYFKSFKKENPNKTPHFLWNAKMRFGKTFTTYQLAKQMKWKKVLVLTFKPAVEDAWREDLNTHTDFKGWRFFSKNEAENISSKIDLSKTNLVCFGSFQDYLGTQKDGSIKVKNEWVHKTEWDCVVFDEYHFGAWRENAKDLFGKDSDAEKEMETFKEIEQKGFSDEDKVDVLEAILPIKANHFLYLSGTPFRAINSGEFIEEQIYNWTYSDEQQAKENWDNSKGPNPYASLPRMVMLTYQLPETITKVAELGEFDGFDLNLFFKAEGEGNKARFKYEDDVQKWLDLIRGSFQEQIVDTLKLKTEKPPLPYSDIRLKSVLNHSLWFLPSVAACHAMANLLKKRNNQFYHDYKVIIAAGTEAGIGVKALEPVLNAMEEPLQSKTITLSCGKLTTGVSVKPWTGIFMLRNSSSPETYFQAAFRVQTPWVIKNPDSKSPNKEEILKEECYVFDFAPNRALKQIAEYACNLNINESNPEKNVEEFINFLPVLAYDGSSMKQIDAAGILDIAMSGTTATLLARRWESALLVNVDNNTLQRLMNNEEAMKALMNIEGFRNLNQDIETIINKSDKIKKAKKEGTDKLSSKQKKELTEEEKKYKSLRKQIQEKLIKFATRIPVFMYLTDYRERSLKDVITKLEPKLFRKVTGLNVKDFELLVSLGVFNSALMNDAVYKFKRYEDASLEYTGINKHADEDIGLYDTTLTRQEYLTFKNVTK